MTTSDQKECLACRYSSGKRCANHPVAPVTRKERYAARVTPAGFEPRSERAVESRSYALTLWDEIDKSEKNVREGEGEFLESVVRQLEDGHRLTRKQAQWLVDIHGRVVD